MSTYLGGEVHVVVAKAWERDDIVTLALRPLSGTPQPFEPAQACMLGAVGVGEASIAISSRVDEGDHRSFTVRVVDPVTDALAATPVGGTVTVRGPFGRGWPLHRLEGPDLLIVADGLGLAPLRAATDAALRAPRIRRLSLVYGAARPSDQLFTADLVRWHRSGVRLTTIVEEADDSWDGSTGSASEALDATSIGFVRRTSAALVCGPDPMMRDVTARLLEFGYSPDRIWLAPGSTTAGPTNACEHCQLGAFAVCRRDNVVSAADLTHCLWLAQQ